MTNDTSNNQSPDQKGPISFGMRLKNAREAMGLDRTDAAEQLRLNEKVIIMMEKDRYPVDLPVTFIRGYLRAYSKLLEIPEHEVKKAIEPMKQKNVIQDLTHTIPKSVPVTSSNYFMQFLTYLIVLTLFGLVGTWWYTHNSQVTSLPVEVTAPLQSQPIPENMSVSPMVVEPTIAPPSQPNTSQPAANQTQSSVNPSNPPQPRVIQTPASNANQTTPPIQPSVGQAPLSPNTETSSPAAEKSSPPRTVTQPVVELPSPLGSNVTLSRPKSTKKIEPNSEEEDYADDIDNIEATSDNTAD